MSHNLKEKIDVYKIRVEELDRNYFSHRELEWRITLQFLSGYAAIGAGYYALRKDGPNEFLGWWCIAIIGLLFIAYLFFGSLHRQRLRWTRELKNDYLAKLHTLSGVPQEEAGKTYTPRFPHFYAFGTQIFVHIIAVISAVAYIYKTMK
ncbi:hypothetical protein [Fimbriiglobus ruber]|uniref:hypothetical protein n=1 Tax=Fimbriiglobus ruber TaxID=1908690 RepID=UPI000B4B9C7F|nr:hypothetical protein [Fimbriiglobus ruber]